MIEITVPMTLTLRTVVLAGIDDLAPAWLVDEYRRMPSLVERKEESGAKAQQQLELDQLRQERDTWRRGLQELQGAVGQIDAQCALILNDVRVAAVELAHAIASKLVFQQLKAGTFPIERLVAEVLGRLNTHEPTTIRLHPEDLASLQKDDESLQTLNPEGTLRLMADPKLARGDCKAACGEITIVYELQRQIEEIRRELLSTVSGHAEPGP